MHSWGWRLPFLVAGPLGLIGLYLRSQARGHPGVPGAGARPARRRSATATQFKDLVADYWRPLLRLAALVVALNVVNYTLLELHADLPRDRRSA